MAQWKRCQQDDLKQTLAPLEVLLNAEILVYHMMGDCIIHQLATFLVLLYQECSCHSANENWQSGTWSHTSSTLAHIFYFCKYSACYLKEQKNWGYLPFNMQSVVAEIWSTECTIQFPTGDHGWPKILDAATKTAAIALRNMLSETYRNWYNWCKTKQ